MKWGDHLVRAVGFSALLLASPVWSQFAPQGFESAQTETSDFDRWQKMSPAEKRALRERYRQRKNMPSNEQDELQKNFDNWRRLDPEEKAAARKNFRRWQNMSPEQRERLKQRWQEYRRLSPERRAEMKRRFRQLRNMSPEQRRELRRQWREKREQLSPEEKQQMHK